MDEKAAAAWLASLPYPVRRRLMDMLSGAAVALGAAPVPAQAKAPAQAKPAGRRPDPAFRQFAAGKPELMTALLDFEDMRNRIRKPMTPKARQMLCASLEKLSGDTREQIAILEQSVFKGWQGVYALKGDFKQRAQRTAMDDLRDLHRRYSEEERVQ